MDNDTNRQFRHWFQQATGHDPYPFQVRFACAPTLFSRPSPLVGEGAGEGARSGAGLLVDVPTGLGKTAMAVLGWLWRRRFHPDNAIRQATPRRLVYCLPMRVLVEQTVREAKQWIAELGKHYPQEMARPPGVHILMGGEIDNDWDTYPEGDAVLIGTQDQLLSRALNRGYAMSRYRWPMHYGLLNNDCLWVMDEVQLMGVGLATTAQLQAFRERFGTCGPAKSVWMSATLKTEALATVDFAEQAKALPSLSLSRDDTRHADIEKRVNAKKSLRRALTKWTQESEDTYAEELAEEVCHQHQEGALTLVIVNRVGRAQSVFKALQHKFKGAKPQPDLCLIHSRFRHTERKRFDQALKEKPAQDRIVVATQAIEAGVDISARTLFTELAPWSSLVQRFGRCNRYGEWQKDEPANVFWIDVETSSVNKKGEQEPSPQAALPYELEELNWSRGQLTKLNDVGPATVSKIRAPEREKYGHVLRRRDALDLFDTTPDLAGNDIDVSRYIRDGRDTDAQVYWREWEGEQPPIDAPAPRPDELCPVGIGRFKEFLKKDVRAYRWDGLDRQWVQVTKEHVWPGLTILLHISEGGYSEDLGWTGNPEDHVSPVPLPAELPSNDAIDEDQFTFIKRFVLLSEHSKDVAQEMAKLKTALDHPERGIPWNDLLTAARWHDLGKAHPVFQKMLLAPLAAADPKRTDGPWAKSDHRSSHCDRKHFRHELASALGLLLHKESDLAAYLAAAHHGKVRLSIRSLPDEEMPPDGRRFARGVWEGDELPAVDLKDGIMTQPLVLTLSFMEMGEGPHGPSWLERMLRLREQHGPFRLAWMESLVRVADWRGTEKEGDGHA
ncbi:MAG: CRISPR-associated helicase Cas3' [Nitrospirota bacterium]